MARSRALDMRGLTRRQLLAGVSAAALCAAMPPPADAAIGMGVAASSSGGGGGGATTTITFSNTSGSASPTPTPIQTYQTFARGNVPSGSIAVPQVSGVDLTYQADNRIFWDDGSLMGATYRLLAASISGSSAQQVTFVVRSGSWNNASSNTTADITGATNYKIVISNCHSVQIPSSVWSSASDFGCVPLKISGGQISGGTVWFPSSLSFSTTAVEGGGGTGGQVSCSGGVLTVVSAGSGYGFVGGGSGSFTASFNTGIATVNGSGNHVGAYLAQYAKGPVCDAWRLRIPTPSLPHHHVTFYIERWKNAAGAFLAFKRYAICGNALLTFGTAIPNYTYDVDFVDGVTQLWGAASGTTGATNLINYMGSSFGTFDSQARPLWSANDTAYKAVIQQRTLTECDQFKHSGVTMPWLAITPTATVPTTPATFEEGTSGGRAFLCNYQPMGTAGLRAPLGSGGTGNMENPVSDLDTLYWMSLRSGTAGAATWFQNARVSGAHCLATPNLGSGVFDPTTLYIPNIVPASAQAFAGMTPTVEASSGFDLTNTGYGHPVPLSFDRPNMGLAGDTYHATVSVLGPYLIEGEQWMLDVMAQAGSSSAFATYTGSRRNATLGATTYYGVYADAAAGIRVPTWLVRSLGFGARFHPTLWADGTTAVEQSYLQYLTKNQFDYWNAIKTFTGTVTWGSSNTFTKGSSLAGSGCWPEFCAGSQTIDSVIGEWEQPFMLDYVMQNAVYLAWLFQGTATGSSIVTFRDEMKIQYVKTYAYAGAHYLQDSYGINTLDRYNSDTPSDTSWSSWGDVSNPKLGIRTEGVGGGLADRFSFTNGSSTVTLSDGNAMRFLGSTRVASGSRMKLSKFNFEQGAPGPTLPVNFNDTTWYYWKELTTTTGQLCTDAGLTLPVTAGSTASTIEFWCVPSNTLPADNSGNGTYNGQTLAGGVSRIATKLGTLRLCQAFGMADDANGNVTNAIANCLAIFNAIPSQTGYGADPQYAWDSSF